GPLPAEQLLHLAVAVRAAAAEEVHVLRSHVGPSSEGVTVPPRRRSMSEVRFTDVARVRQRRGQRGKRLHWRTRGVRWGGTDTPAGNTPMSSPSDRTATRRDFLRATAAGAAGLALSATANASGGLRPPLAGSAK